MEITPPPARPDETVLVVEDGRDLGEVVDRILSRNGYRVLVAGNGPEALELAGSADEPIHLILCDVMLPGMSGRELVRKVTAMFPQIRVLYMSGYAKPVLVARGTLGPGDVLVEKPFARHELLARVREVLDA